MTQPFAQALAEAEQIIAGAPHVKSERDLAEGHDYLAGSIQASLRLAWAYQRDFPYFVQSTGPYSKMGLDNPDTLYFHAYLRDDAEYVVTGTRGTTADLSFQVLKGDYTPVEVPDSLSAFDDRAIDIADDGRFEFRLGPGKAGPGYFTLGPGSAMLLVREVYSDWAAERRGTIRIYRPDQAGHAPPPVTDTATAAKRYAVAGKMLLSRLRTFLAFPEWFYLNEPVNTMTPPRATPGGLATQFSSAGHFDLKRRRGDDRDRARRRQGDRAVPGHPARQHVVHLARLRQPPDQPHRRSGPGRPGRPDALRDQRAEPRGRQLARADRARPGLRADPLAAADPRPATGRRPAGRGRPARRTPATDSPFYDQARVSELQWRARIAARQAAFAERMLG